MYSLIIISYFTPEEVYRHAVTGEERVYENLFGEMSSGSDTEQVPDTAERKLSIVDVKCKDEREL